MIELRLSSADGWVYRKTMSDLNADSLSDLDWESFLFEVLVLEPDDKAYSMLLDLAQRGYITGCEWRST